MRVVRIAIAMIALGAGSARAQVCVSPTVNPWSIATLWTWGGVISGGGENIYQHVVGTPLVAQLDDDNLDGTIDGTDTADVIVIADDGSYFNNPLVPSSSALVIINGHTGATRWWAPGYSLMDGAAIAELDGTPPAEIIAVDTMLGTLVAIHADGTPYWNASPSVPVSVPPFAGLSYGQINVADLDRNGTLEVLVDRAVVDGQTGIVLQIFSEPGRWYSEPVPVDVDGDGDLEVLFGRSIFDRSSANPIWTAPINDSVEVWPLALEYDGDPLPELAFINDEGYALFDDDHALLASVFQPPPALGVVSPACTGDFDGDGEMELVWSADDELIGIELDGTNLWTTTPTATDPSGGASCAAFDLDGDGRDELIFAGEVDFTIYDGLTATVLLGPLPHTSATIFETPAIADIDGDGGSEILIGHNYGGLTGVTAYEHRGSGWSPSGSDWLVYPHRPFVARPDGVATSTAINVPITNRVRSRPIGARCGDGFADFCEECDDGNAIAGDGCSPSCTLEQPPDAGVPPDAAIMPDAGVEPDAEIQADAEIMQPDAEIFPDAEIHPDAEIMQPDAEIIQPDAEIHADAEIQADAEIPDAGVQMIDAGDPAQIEDDDCACTAHNKNRASPAWLLFLAVAALLRRSPENRRSVTRSGTVARA